VPLARGAVYRTLVQVTRARGGGTDWAEKYIVLLQDPESMDPHATSYAFVIASTDRSGAQASRSFEVRLGEVDGFHHSTIVDGRWVYTSLRAELDEESYCFMLREERMDEVSLAVFIGLQLTP
jgi:hypothetical protein